MANLKEIRTRIASVTTTRQVTSAMKMVSAAKLKKAQDLILQIRPYADKLQEILSSISSALRNQEESIFTAPKEPNKVLIVVLSSNRGLCGAFNSNIVKKTIDHIEENYFLQYKRDDLHFLAIGKQGEKHLRSLNLRVIGEENALLDNISFENTTILTERLMDYFKAGKYDRIDIVYNQFKNAAVQILTAKQFLPIKPDEKRSNDIILLDYIFEPSKETIIEELIPKSLKTQFYEVLLDSNAAEHGARMTAMHQATDNATSLIDDLKLTYNKARQAAITEEILEITSGAEALKG
ncbi:ATP synthase F1 subunit gamma [Puteibacter caeruleilacunae]|nr:ATP synthase F1 subunit gamma [Puteibacter caeruleilacunae]